MKRKGFTLIEVIMGLFLLGLIAATILPKINISHLRLSNQNIKMEMIHMGEMVIERIKAFKEDSSEPISIYNVKIEDLIEEFKKDKIVEIILPKDKNSEKYSLKIIKDEKFDNLWLLSVYVYHNKEGKVLDYVEFKGYMPKK
ncbi:prepilin-type N-terminal cleavage/methylation domain-containing protein [Tissierella sp. MB52-C2]|uniref:prepilin-type N-terminal cleavage/methylation domain-containing protein n=1 Tax=Tissierella sp. MB52-C2 TaxID=3070999 RepID=UPI00280BE3CB|nr:prepilin-type N-terminal cleavage/methylation domain-containing protein [Tissierella sp. MB52-C2]WMM26934.1 prepilin-type N-terminal cleavage/methylation domain-containing protein [Tissierella sp. MB52-C2]